ncbi:MAG: alpha/beta hydrolase family protein [Fimbriimonadaceae bacterium]|nr:alpha/beta hydrolase family protein [Fimbriimonadaceae bacterium]
MIERAATKIILAFLAVLGSSLTLAQGPDLKQPPPATTFSAWTKVAEENTLSEYTVTLPSAVESPFPENNAIPLNVFVPARTVQATPVVIILHYWGATDQRAERNQAQDLARRGIASVLMPLPYHLARTPKGSRSGELAIVADPQKLVETMTQCVLDVRRTIDWIATRPEFDSSRVGIAGTSLGSLVATITCGVDKRLTHGAFVLAGADIAGILWKSSRVVKQREQFRKDGYTEESLRKALQSIEPLNYLAGRGLQSSLIIGAKYDTVIPPDSTDKLISALDGAKTVWLDTGHYGGFFIQKKVQNTVGAYFEAEFAGLDYTPPSSLTAPTIRIGVLGDTEDGLQVAVGLDVWRSNSKSEFFASAIATPRGLRGFVGFRLDKGLSLGAGIHPKGVRPGVFWSIVL